MARIDGTGILEIDPGVPIRDMKDGLRFARASVCVALNKNGARCESYHASETVVVDGVLAYVCRTHFNRVERAVQKRYEKARAEARRDAARMTLGLKEAHGYGLHDDTWRDEGVPAMGDDDVTVCPDCEEILGVQTYRVEDWETAARIERKVNHEIEKLTADLAKWHETFSDPTKPFSALMRSGNELVRAETFLSAYEMVRDQAAGFTWIEARDRVRHWLERRIYSYGSRSTSGFYNEIEAAQHAAYIQLVDGEFNWM